MAKEAVPVATQLLDAAPGARRMLKAMAVAAMPHRPSTVCREQEASRGGARSAKSITAHSAPAQPLVAREEVGQNSKVTPAGAMPRMVSKAANAATGDGGSPPLAEARAIASRTAA